MVQEIVGQVVANVSEDSAAKHRHGCEPVVEEDCMGQLPEGNSQDHEQCRGHNKAVPVHREVVVNTVEEEVKSQADTVVREPVVNVEQEAVHQILDQSPEAHTTNPV